MIKNPQDLKDFEDRLIKEETPASFDRAMELFSAMWEEAVLFNVLPASDPLEGIETRIRIAKVLNSCLRTFSPG